ncbi:MAG: hypothetical protein IIV90_01270, partial [Oscillospiraceae bacterium]|nr:hypothetical protein [Oscillospiraceae bacterium]
EKAVFSIKATGTGLTYQWQYLAQGKADIEANWKATTFSGNKTDTLTVTTKETHDGYMYRCKVADANCNTIVSHNAFLTVNKAAAPLAITSSPANATVTAGEKAKFSVAATGEGLAYQWYYKSPTGSSFKQTTFAGNKTDTLTVTTKATHNGYQYKCKVTDANGNEKWSSAAALTVQSSSQPAVTITTQPESVNVKYGYVYFTVGASREDVTYQWQYKSPAGTSFKSTTLTGNKTDTLKVYGNASRDGYQYRCKVTDGDGNVAYSEPALLGVLTIAAQPADIVVKAGEKASFTVEATGQGLSYQWYYKSPTGTSFKRTTWAGAKTDTLTVTTKPDDISYNGYQYKCKVTDASGNYRWSEAAELGVGLFYG